MRYRHLLTATTAFHQIIAPHTSRGVAAREQAEADRAEAAGEENAAGSGDAEKGWGS